MATVHVSDIPVVVTPPLDLATLAESARALMDSAKSDRTIAGYRSDWRQFSSWCERNSLQSLPAAPETVALYLASMAGVKAAATIQRHLSSISQAHQSNGIETPTSAPIVRTTWKGIRRQFGTATNGKAPARTADIRAMVETLDDRLIGTRDRALILVGFAGAFRRSELVSLNIEDVSNTADGLVVTVRRSKTDQEGAGEVIGIPYGSTPATCPVRAYRAWLDASGVESGPVFRPVCRHSRLGLCSEQHDPSRRLGAKTVADVVKRTARAAGLDASMYSGHSLRAGLITSAAESGVAERDIMRQSRHKSVPVMRRYIRGATVWQSNAAASVGL